MGAPGSTRAVLFDLDGTLADTAPDMARALNAVRATRGLPALPLEQVRPYVSRGARGMVQTGFGLLADDPGFAVLRDAFLDEYERHVFVDTLLFAGMEAVLTSLESAAIPWGIVTNKASRFTLPLVRAMGLHERAACIVCGDTTPHIKPHPEPLLHACRQIPVDPRFALYIGDDERDIQAGRAAGMRVLAAEYGYIGTGTSPAEWQADALISHAGDILQHL